MEIKKSLDPVVNNQARVLILGSMPGEESLRKQEYYGHPRNHFWRLISDITGTSFQPLYSGRISLALEHSIALWDVIGSCLREGSLDTNIKDEVPNALFELIDGFKSLRAVVFNGQKSAMSFKRHFGYSSLSDRGLSYLIMPSTSPANTAPYEDKLAAWSGIKIFFT